MMKSLEISFNIIQVVGIEKIPFDFRKPLTLHVKSRDV